LNEVWLEFSAKIIISFLSNFLWPEKLTKKNKLSNFEKPQVFYNKTDQKTNFRKNFMRIGGIEKHSFLSRPYWNFSSFFFVCFISINKNQSKCHEWQGWVEILMITLVYSKSVRNNILHSV
jgi:hypothetical protein